MAAAEPINASVDCVVYLHAASCVADLCEKVIAAGSLTVHDHENVVCLVWDDDDMRVDWDLPPLSPATRLSRAGCGSMAVCACAGTEPSPSAEVANYALAIVELSRCKLTDQRDGFVVRCELNGGRAPAADQAAQDDRSRLEDAVQEQMPISDTMDSSGGCSEHQDAAKRAERSTGSASCLETRKPSAADITGDESTSPELARMFWERVIPDPHTSGWPASGLRQALLGVGIPAGIASMAQASTRKASSAVPESSEYWPGGSHNSSGRGWSSISTVSTDDDGTAPAKLGEVGININRLQGPSDKYMRTRGVEYPWLRTGEAVRDPESTFPVDHADTAAQIVYDVGVFPLQLRSGGGGRRLRHGHIKAMIMRNLAKLAITNSCSIPITGYYDTSGQLSKAL